MITTFHQKRIRGVLGVLPENEYDYDEETKPFQDIHTHINPMSLSLISLLCAFHNP